MERFTQRIFGKIYDEIQNNEIKLQSEQHAALLAGDLSIPASGQSIGFFGGRDVTREAYIHASKEMSTKTEKLMRNLGKNQNQMTWKVFSMLQVMCCTSNPF